MSAVFHMMSKLSQKICFDPFSDEETAKEPEGNRHYEIKIASVSDNFF